MKSLVINADDFGISERISDGILHGLLKKNISDVSILANGAAFDYAAALLKQNGIHHCGIHLCFIDKEVPLSEAPATVMEGRHFHTSRYRFLWQFLRNEKAVLRFLEKELCAQIEMVRQAGLQLSHLDGHQHLHVFPRIADLAVDLCVNYRIPFIRAPFSHQFSPAFLAVRVFSSRVRKLAGRAGIRYVETLGFKASGHLNRAYLEHYCAKIRKSDENAFELMTHPGFFDADAKQKYAHWGYSWETELEALQMLTPEYLETNGIERTDFSLLALR